MVNHSRPNPYFFNIWLVIELDMYLDYIKMI